MFTVPHEISRIDGLYVFFRLFSNLARLSTRFMTSLLTNKSILYINLLFGEIMNNDIQSTIPHLNTSFDVYSFMIMLLSPSPCCYTSFPHPLFHQGINHPLLPSPLGAPRISWSILRQQISDNILTKIYLYSISCLSRKMKNWSI